MLGSPCNPCCGGCRPIVYAWGDHTSYQLGNCTMSGTVVSPPDFVDQLDWSQLAGGAYAGAGIENGNLWTWGGLTWADIGWGDVGSTYAPRWIPRQVSGTWSQVSLGTTVMLAIDTSGKLYSCGSADTTGGNSGQLGLPDVSDPATVYTLTQVGSGSNWTQCHASKTSACGVLDGHIYYWGVSYANENYPAIYTTPRRLTSFSPQVVKVQDNGEYRMALTTGGDLYAWWFWDSHPDPVLIDTGVADFAVTEPLHFFYIYPSSNVARNVGAVYLKTDGTLCQSPLYRMQGNFSAPLIEFSGTWSAVAGYSGAAFGMAVNSDGHLFTWGSDTGAALGNGSESSAVNAPVQVGSKTWRPVIACGATSAYAKAIQ